jgi:serine/threonine-protein kinase
MSAVFSARDERLGRKVAMKLMLPNLATSREAVLRFVNEARSLARIESRHVISIHDCGVIKESPDQVALPFMVLELLEGSDLWAYEHQQGPLDVSRIVSFALQICEGLAAAHAEGVIHRDLKPENLFVAIEPEGGECMKVLDFGVARASEVQRPLTASKEGLGSPGYMSPEQLRDPHDVDARSDIWSLGVVMHELLANRPLFDGETPYELCAQVLGSEIPGLADLRPNLPVGLSDLVARCLERERAHRFQDVGELATALAPFADRPMDRELARIQRRLDRTSTEPVLLQSSKPLKMSTPPPAMELDPVISVVEDPSDSEPDPVLPIGRARPRHRVMSALALAALALLPAAIALFAFFGDTTRITQATSVMSSRIAPVAEDLSARITEVAESVRATASNSHTPPSPSR